MYGAERETTPVQLSNISGSATLTEKNLPQQSYSATFTQTAGTVSIPVVEDDANTEEPTGAKLAIPSLTGTNNKIYSNAAGTASLAEGTARVTGTVAVENSGHPSPAPVQVSMQGNGTATIIPIQPSIGVNYIICMQGLYPSRSWLKR